MATKKNVLAALRIMVILAVLFTACGASNTATPGDRPSSGAAAQTGSGEAVKSVVTGDADVTVEINQALGVQN